MTEVQQGLGPGLGMLVAGAFLALGAWVAVRSAGPMTTVVRGQGRRRARPAEPAPVAGGAAGLLEAIPFLQPARPRRRLRGTARLSVALVLAAALIASIAFALGRALVSWMSRFDVS